METCLGLIKLHCTFRIGSELILYCIKDGVHEIQDGFCVVLAALSAAPSVRPDDLVKSSTHKASARV